MVLLVILFVVFMICIVFVFFIPHPVRKGVSLSHTASYIVCLDISNIVMGSVGTLCFIAEFCTQVESSSYHTMQDTGVTCWLPPTQATPRFYLVAKGQFSHSYKIESRSGLGMRVTSTNVLIFIFQWRVFLLHSTFAWQSINFSCSCCISTGVKSL